MNEEMNRRKEWNERKSRGRIWTGLLLLLIGALLLFRSTDLISFPSWFFTWPVLVIAIGLISGIKHGFRGPFWAIMLLIGGFGLAGKLDPTLNLERYIWPVIIMGLGLMFLLRPKRPYCRHWQHRRQGAAAQEEFTPVVSEEMYEGEADRRDFIDITAVFGGVKKNILSKNFKGGEIVTFMGGSEINLTQADFTGRITIDTTNIFGGTKLIVPPTWDVQSDITAVFGGVDDKRQISGVQPDPDKLLVLDGTCLFGGIEIRSF